MLCNNFIVQCLASFDSFMLVKHGHLPVQGACKVAKQVQISALLEMEAKYLIAGLFPVACSIHINAHGYWRTDELGDLISSFIIEE